MLTRNILRKSEEGIDKSEFYMALVTDNMLKDEQCLYEWNYAKRIKKPFMLVIKNGVKIPKEMLEGINILSQDYFDNNQDIEKIANKMRKDIGLMEFIDNHD